jgi:hypothetical protein
MERARRFVERRGHTRKRLYEDMTARFAGEVQKAAAAPIPPDTGERFKISTEGLPKKGASAFARVAVVECGDFDCPYCQRATKTIDRVIADYPSQVSFYFLHNPLSFHPNAESAARAAVAADKQGKFWEMHDKLFADQESRTEADFIRFATELKMGRGQVQDRLRGGGDGEDRGGSEEDLQRQPSQRHAVVLREWPPDGRRTALRDLPRRPGCRARRRDLAAASKPVSLRQGSGFRTVRVL